MEEWKDYRGYLVSNQGRIKNKHGHILTPYLKHNGYEAIDLRVDGNVEKYRVNRLVAYVWLPLPTEEGLECHHINSIRDDNRACNLQWITKQENNRIRWIRAGKRPNSI